MHVNIDNSILKVWKGEAFLATLRITVSKSLDDIAKKKIDQLEKIIIKGLKDEGEKVHEASIIKRIRSTFRAMPDMDPTRYRPASESLIRRVLKDGFFRINQYVDINNLLSIKLKIPLGIYDFSKIESKMLSLRIGYKNERYATISQRIKKADGKMVLADYKGVIGSPVTDSGRALVDNKSEKIVVIGYLPFDASIEEAEQLLKIIENSFCEVFNPVISNGKLF